MGPLVRLFLLVGLALVLAGCVQGPGAGNATEGEDGWTPLPTPTHAPSPSPTPEPRSNETLLIRIEAEGSWRVAVPLPVSDPGTSAEEWEANLTAEGDAKTGLVETDHGTVLEVTGAGYVVLESHAIQPPLRGNRCCAEAYLDAEWSAGTDDGGNVRAGVWEGSIIIEIEYDATSRFCYRTDHYVGAGEAPDDVVGLPAEEDDPIWFPLGGERRTGCA